MEHRQLKFGLLAQIFSRVNHLKIPERVMISSDENMLTIIDNIAGSFIEIGIAPPAKFPGSFNKDNLCTA